jgi:gamma-glutamyltranspeptidase/glutathione hydrolase
MDVQQAIDAPRIHEQWMPDTIMLEPFTLSPDTRRILEGRGYNFTDAGVWGIAEGIVVGDVPRLAPPPKTSSSLLMVSDKPLKGATMFGAHDSRTGAGAAVPVH